MILARQHPRAGHEAVLLLVQLLQSERENLLFAGTKFSNFATFVFQWLNLAATKDFFKSVTIP